MNGTSAFGCVTGAPSEYFVTQKSQGAKDSQADVPEGNANGQGSADHSVRNQVGPPALMGPPETPEVAAIGGAAQISNNLLCTAGMMSGK